MGPQLAVEQVEMIEGETAKLALRVLDDRGRPFLADAQDDVRVLGEPGPFGGGQQIGAGGDAQADQRQDDAHRQQRQRRAASFHVAAQGVKGHARGPYAFARHSLFDQSDNNHTDARPRRQFGFLKLWK